MIPLVNKAGRKTMSDSSKERRFHWIYQKFRDPVYRTCCFYIQDPDLRQDLFQDVFLKIWRGLDSLKNPEAVKTWVYRIATNTALSMAMRSRKDLIRIDQIPGDIPADRETESTSTLDQTDEIHRMMRCVHRLNAQDQVLVGLLLEELSSKEMAEVTGLSESNVRVRIHRSKKRLKELMEEEKNGLETDQ